MSRQLVVLEPPLLPGVVPSVTPRISLLQLDYQVFRSFSLCFSFAFHNNNSTDNEFLNSSAFRGCGVHCRYLRLVVVFDPDNCSWRIAGLRGTGQPQRLTRYGLGWGHRHIYSFRGNYKGKESIHYAQTKVFRCTKKSNCLYFVYLQYTVSLTRAVSGELVAEFEASHLQMALLSPGVGRKDNSDVTMLPLVLDTEIKGWLPINQSEHTMTIGTYMTHCICSYARH